MIHIPVAGAVILRKNKFNESEVLLIRRSPTDHWKLIWEFREEKLKKVRI